LIDYWGKETDWNIKDSNNALQAHGGEYTGNTLTEVDLCLPDGAYTFEIVDGYSDGICCDSGQGYYKLESNGAVVFTGGNFGYTETKPFTIEPASAPPTTPPPTSAPTDSGCPAPNTSALFSILIDYWGKETDWNIKDSNNALQAHGGEYTGNTLTEVDLCLPDGAYTFEIVDGYSDGICCDSGQGYYKLESNGAVVFTGGNFGYTETKPFTISNIL